MNIRHILCLLLVASLSVTPSIATGQTYKVDDKIQNEMGVEDKLGAELPLDLTFTTSSGKTKPLSEFFNNDKPKLLMLIYYNCPMLCNLTLNAQVDQFKELGWTPGEEFEILTISIDPTEDAELAEAKKGSYIQSLGNSEAADGWHWCVGEDENITKLAETVGFKYYWDEKQNQYAHPSAVFVLTPEGKLTNSLSGLETSALPLKKALFDAGDGKVGSFTDRVYLRCLHFDPSTGKLTPRIMFIVKIFGFLTVIVIGSMIGLLRYMEIRKNRRAHSSQTAPAH